MKQTEQSTEAPADAGTGQPAASERPAASPPAAAEIVAAGKSENEIKLEKENAKLRRTVAQTAEQKRKVEIANGHLANENQQLKQIPSSTQPAAIKRAWLAGW